MRNVFQTDLPWMFLEMDFSHARDWTFLVSRFFEDEAEYTEAIETFPGAVQARGKELNA